MPKLSKGQLLPVEDSALGESLLPKQGPPDQGSSPAAASTPKACTRATCTHGDGLPDGIGFFPAVGRAGGDDDEKADYWRSSAKTWDKMIPEKFLFFEVGNKHVREVATRLRDEEKCKEPLPLQCAAGPAVPIAFWAIRMTWLLFLLVPLPVWEESYCTDGNGSSWLNDHFGISTQPPAGQAVYPTAHVWMFAGPYVLYLLYVEWQILQYMIIPQVQVTGGFFTFGKRVGFYVWLPVSFCMSFIGHLDLVTNGIFLATAWRMTTCPFGPEIDCIWTDTMKGSVFKYVPWLTTDLQWSTLTECVQPSFSFFVLVLWIFMFTQAIHGLAGAVPLFHIYHKCIKHFDCLQRLYQHAEARYGWNGQGITEEVRLDPTSKRFKTKQQCHDDPDFYQLYSHTAINEYWDADMKGTGSHGATDKYLSEVVDYEHKEYEYIRKFVGSAMGCGTMYQTVLDETRQSTSDHGTAVIGLMESCRMYTMTSMQVKYSREKVKYYLECAKKDGPAYGITKRVLQAIGHKVVLVGIFQNGVHINLQITFFAMTSLLERDGALPKGFTLDEMFHVNVQVLFSICVSLFVLIRNLAESVQLLLWVGTVLQAEHGAAIGKPEYFAVFIKKYNRLKVGLAFYSIIIFYAILKFCKVFTCPGSLYNLTGCAVINNSSLHGVCALTIAPRVV